jgi:hypothetical protein
MLKLQRRHDNETHTSSQMLAIHENLQACFSNIQNDEGQTISIYDAFKWSYEEAFPEKPSPLALDYISSDCRLPPVPNTLANADTYYKLLDECRVDAACSGPELSAAEAKVNRSICTFQKLLLWWWKRGMLILGFYVILNLARTFLFPYVVAKYLLLSTWGRLATET